MTSESVPIPSSLREARIGVSYNVCSSSPSPAAAMAASIASSAGFAAVRIVNPVPDHIRAFSGSPLPVFLSIPNEAVAGFGKNSVLARDWIDQNLVPFVDTVKFTVISLGIDFLISFPDDKLLMDALNNFQDSLKELQLDSKIKVSTTFSFEHIIQPAFPPSAAQFSNEDIMLEILSFIAKIKSFFIVNLYPQSLYRDGTHGYSDGTQTHYLTIGFTLSEKNPLSYIQDPLDCQRYYGLLDSMLSSVFYAITSAAKGKGSFNHGDIPLIIAETGWPVSSLYEDPSETEAMAAIYFDNLVAYFSSSTYRNSRVAYTFIYKLFDDTHKNMDQNTNRLWDNDDTTWGIYSDNGRSKYPTVFPSPSQPMD